MKHPANAKPSCQDVALVWTFCRSRHLPRRVFSALCPCALKERTTTRRKPKQSSDTIIVIRCIRVRQLTCMWTNRETIRRNLYVVKVKTTYKWQTEDKRCWAQLALNGL